MKKVFPILLAFAIVILFFIQLAGTLVESIYILDLMNLKLDEKVSGLLFFFVPLLLFPLFKKFPKQSAWVGFAILFISRGLLPDLSTSYRFLASGFGTSTAFSLFLLLLEAKPKGENGIQIGTLGSASFGLALAFSVFLRTWGDGLDISLIPEGRWLGWFFGSLLGASLTQLDWQRDNTRLNQRNNLTGATVGVILLLTLVWFSFSAPAVLARWTEGNYTLIVVTISLFAVGWIFISLARPQWLGRISSRILLLWNAFFTLSLTTTILTHSVSFPATADSALVVVTAPSPFAQISLALMLLLFPVIFLDMRLFLRQIQRAAPSASQLLPGILLGTLTMVLLIFAHIFTNVWGYVPPVSPLFRGKFWLPYFVLTGLITFLVWRVKASENGSERISIGRIHPSWGLPLAVLFLGTVWMSIPGVPVQVDAAQRTSLIVMTYNTQQSNDDAGEKSFERQLALIHKVAPDVLALQESDSTRPALNNNDYVRYFADKLGYYCYYGPATVTGTYGTAILSKYPLLNTQTVFSYSDTDEIGISEAEIEVHGIRISIYDVHPDGSETAKLAFAKTLLERSQDKPYVIALGDYNLREDTKAYQLIDSVYIEAWRSIYPTNAGAAGTTSPDNDRIDHIFVSPSLSIKNPIYVLPPESASDHPVHWAEIYWNVP